MEKTGAGLVVSGPPSPFLEAPEAPFPPAEKARESVVLLTKECPLSVGNCAPGHLQLAGRPRELRAPSPLSLQPCFLKDWEMHVHFKVHGAGKKNLHGDGIALWYTRDRLVQGRAVLTYVGASVPRILHSALFLIGCCCSSLRKPGTFEKRRGWVLLYPMVASAKNFFLSS